MRISDADRLLFGAATKAVARAHAPYSEFPVGAALRSASGAVYCGGNVEIASYPEGWCAETSAIAAMIAAGDKKIAAIAVVAPKLSHITPCGGCRQRLAEFADAQTPVILGDMTGPQDIVPLGDLLPRAFDKSALI